MSKLKNFGKKIAVAGSAMTASVSAFAVDHSASITAAQTDATTNVTAVVTAVIAVCVIVFGGKLVISWLTGR